MAGPSRHSYTKDRAQLLRRLARMEGQVRGIARMIERDDYCIDILQQTAALKAAGIPGKSVVVSADTEAPQGLVVQAMLRARGAGVEHFLIAVKHD